MKRCRKKKLANGRKCKYNYECKSRKCRYKIDKKWCIFKFMCQRELQFSDGKEALNVVRPEERWDELVPNALEAITATATAAGLP